MLVNHHDARITTPVHGITRRVLAYTDKVMITEHALKKGAVLPDHRHLHDQLVYLLSGEIILEVNKENIKLLPGDSLSIPSNIIHNAVALRESVALDIFAPARMDYL
jgi:quercetin dioxygenase-like cupin family protein